MQGYYYAPSMEAKDLATILRENPVAVLERGRSLRVVG
jgi:hypothetical protein